MPKIAINGFGRIGRLTGRRILEKHQNLEIAAVNDLSDKQASEHLFKYDSSYGIFNKKLSAEFLAEKDPENLPWKKLDVDVVIECTGVFRTRELAQKHLKAGAKKVIISAPAKSSDIPTYLLGVNAGQYKPAENIVSMGSCTTNCLAPIAKVLDKTFGIAYGFMTTVHSYTNDQRILDLTHQDLRRARAAGLNIIPTTTGAASTVEKVLPNLAGKLQGLALRVPTATVSVVDFVCELKKQARADEINRALEQASQEPEMKDVLAVEKSPLVSSDFIGNSYSAIVDGLSTQSFGKMAKVLAWYDNEYGYACRLAELVEMIAGGK